MSDEKIPWWELPGAPGENRTKEQYYAKLAEARQSKATDLAAELSRMTTERNYHWNMADKLAERVNELGEALKQIQEISGDDYVIYRVAENALNGPGATSDSNGSSRTTPGPLSKGEDFRVWWGRGCPKT